MIMETIMETEKAKEMGNINVKEALGSYRLDTNIFLIIFDKKCRLDILKI